MVETHQMIVNPFDLIFKKLDFLMEELEALKQDKQQNIKLVDDNVKMSIN